MKIERLVATIPITENAIEFKNIDNSYAYKHLHLVVEGSLVLSAGAASGTVITDGILDFIKRIKVEMSGLNEIKEYTGRMLYELNALDFGKVIPCTDPSSGDAATYAIRASIYIHFVSLDNIQPDVTMFNSALYNNQPKIEISYDSLSVLFSAANDRTKVITGNVKVYSLEDINVSPKLNFSISKDRYNKTPITQSGSTEIDLPVGNLINRILFRVIDNGALTDAFINNLTVKVGSTVIKDALKFVDLKDDNIRRYQRTLPVGYAVLDFDADGDFSSLVDARMLKSLKIIYNTNAPTGTGAYIETCLNEVIPPADTVIG